MVACCRILHGGMVLGPDKRGNRKLVALQNKTVANRGGC